jgi:hypothetical protein
VGNHITGYKPELEFELVTNTAPCWESNRGRMNNGKGEFTKLQGSKVLSFMSKGRDKLWRQPHFGDSLSDLCRVLQQILLLRLRQSLHLINTIITVVSELFIAIGISIRIIVVIVIYLEHDASVIIEMIGILVFGYTGIERPDESLGGELEGVVKAADMIVCLERIFELVQLLDELVVGTGVVGGDSKHLEDRA